MRFMAMVFGDVVESSSNKLFIRYTSAVNL